MLIMIANSSRRKLLSTLNPFSELNPPLPLLSKVKFTFCKENSRNCHRANVTITQNNLAHEKRMCLPEHTG